MSAAFAANSMDCFQGGTLALWIGPSKGIPAGRSPGERDRARAWFVLRGSDYDDSHLFGTLK
jgi:hypothetical protein